MKRPNGFYTLKGYQLNEESDITSSMEDYLEMISRMHEYTDNIRITDLAKNLNVKPSSASKMANNLMDSGYVVFKKYGNIILTEKGLEEGKYLLFRHSVLHEFLCLINKTSDELEQVEKIEHFIDRRTIYSISKITDKLKKGLA